MRRSSIGPKGQDRSSSILSSSLHARKWRPEGSKESYHGWKVKYMDLYVADYGQCFMVCQILHQVHLQEVILMQIPTKHVSYMYGAAFGWESRVFMTTQSRSLTHVWSYLKLWFNSHAISSTSHMHSKQCFFFFMCCSPYVAVCGIWAPSPPPSFVQPGVFVFGLIYYGHWLIGLVSIENTSSVFHSLVCTFIIKI